MSTPDAPSRSAPWLSLLLPVYNVQPWLRDCVQSIVGQDVDGIEVVIVDDASTDGSGALAASLADEYAGVVRVIAHPANRGVSVARNTLLDAALGDYVWFVDPDDLLAPGSIRSLARILREHDPDLVLCDYRVVRARFGFKHRMRGELHRRTFRGPARTLLHDRSMLVDGVLSQGQLHVWSKIARRSIWQQVRFPVGHYFEDISAMPPLFAQAASFYYEPVPWVGYRQREHSIMRELTPVKLAHLNEAVVGLHRAVLADARALTPRARFALDHFCLRTYASIARRFRRGLCAQRDDVRTLFRASLGEVFPMGIGHVLAAYGRRGWLLRGVRSRYYLGRLGWLPR